MREHEPVINEDRARIVATVIAAEGVPLAPARNGVERLQVAATGQTFG